MCLERAVVQAPDIDRRPDDLPGAAMHLLLVRVGRDEHVVEAEISQIRGTDELEVAPHRGRSRIVIPGGDDRRPWLERHLDRGKTAPRVLAGSEEDEACWGWQRASAPSEPAHGRAGPDLASGAPRREHRQ